MRRANFTGKPVDGVEPEDLDGNTTVLLPCATIATANQIVVTAGTRNVSLRGCALRGGAAPAGARAARSLPTRGRARWYRWATRLMRRIPGLPSGQRGDQHHRLDQCYGAGLVAYRTQELDLESLYLLGNSNQTGMTLDGTGNYTGGTFLDNQFSGFQTAVNAIGHQVANPATTDWMNASTFVRLHIDCPTSERQSDSGTYGINLQQADGNTFTGGDVEAEHCAALRRERTKQYHRRTAERELDKSGCGRCRQFLQQLDDRRNDVHRKADRQRNAQQLSRHISPQLQGTEW